MYVRKLPSGSWQAVVKVAGRRATVTRRLRREAVDAGEKLRRRLAGETGEVWTNPTIGDAVAERIRTATWAPTLAAEYVRAGDRLPEQFAGRRLDEITVPIVERLYDELARRSVSPYAIRRVHELLRSAFAEAVRVGAIDASPMSQVRPPAKPDRDIHPPSPDQVRAILAGCDGTARVAFTIAATTGLRRGELAAIRWADVDLDEARVAITRSHAYTPADGVHERPTKTGRKGQRTVSLNTDCVALLRAWRAAQLEAALAGQGERPVWVFSDDAGATPWRPDRFTHEFDAARKRAKVAGVRLHDLRHYVATRLLSAGAPVERVAAMLGHTSSATTLEVYRHWIPGEDRDLADLIGRITASG